MFTRSRSAGEIWTQVAGLILGFFIISLLLAFPFMILWNYAAVSALTVAKPIGFWVSFWLLFLLSWIMSMAKNNN